MRSLRDPAIAKIFSQLDEGWRGYLEGLVARGIQQGVFRPDLDPKVTAMVIMTLIKGFGYQFLDRSNHDIADPVLTQLESQVEAWLTRPQQTFGGSDEKGL